MLAKKIGQLEKKIATATYPKLLCVTPFHHSLQVLAKKIGQLEKKVAEHEKAAGGSLPELQVG